MKIAYFDCFSGVSGDMVLGALIDSGIDFEYLKKELTRLQLTSYNIVAKPVMRGKIGATKVSVSAYEKGVVRTWSNISNMIENSGLSPGVKIKSREIFELLARAEAKIHRTEIEKVHFHEVGAIDSIIDIVGAAIAFESLGIDDIFFSPLPTGIGMTRTEHGMLPIPAPATVEILKGVPIYSTGIPSELVTPTGAAIAKSYAKDFIDLPPIKITSVGYGAGREKLETPNLLRLIIGEKTEKPELEQLLLLETNVDNTSPEIIGYLIDRLLEKGALDAWTTPVHMKKNRPGVLISVLSLPGDESTFLDLLLSETDTLGVRVIKHFRYAAAREEREVETVYGKIRIKIGYAGGHPVSLSPEFQDCADAARKTGKPVKTIIETAKEAAKSLLDPS